MSADNFMAIFKEGEKFIGYHCCASMDYKDQEDYKKYGTKYWECDTEEEAIKKAEEEGYLEYGFFFIKKNKEEKMEKTINEMLSLINVVKGRIAELKGLRTQLAVRETYFGNSNKTVEPTYDVKIVDKKIVELQNFLLEADAKIKTSNALTKIEIEVNVKELLSPLA